MKIAISTAAAPALSSSLPPPAGGPCDVIESIQTHRGEEPSGDVQDR